MRSIVLTLCLMLFASVLAEDEIVRESRYTLWDQEGTLISRHNEVHVAIREALQWSRDHAGQTVTIKGLSYRVTADVDTSPSADLSVIQTFESAGLYFKGAQTADPQVSYRRQGAGEWRDAIWMDFDPNDAQWRSSIVGLQPGTDYQVRITNGDQQHYQYFSTWDETDQWPIGKTTQVSGAATITESGTPDGYHLVTGGKVEGGNGCINIQASYVIVRGFECANQTDIPVFIADGVSNVVVERNEVYGWTKANDDFNEGAIVFGNNDGHTNMSRVVVQYNHIHDPGWGVPEDEWGSGVFAILIREEHGGNHVIRYNTFAATAEHAWRDVIGGNRNFGKWGAPGSDTDIYGNYVKYCGDDCFEIEGGNKNVRVWGNYMDEFGVAIAVAGVAKGPVYLFRNVTGEPNGLARGDGLKSGFIKVTTDPMHLCEECGDWHGRHYVLHNTFVNQTADDGSYVSAGNHWSTNPKAQTAIDNIMVVADGHKAFDDGQCYTGDQENRYANNLYWDINSLNDCHAMDNGIRAEPNFAEFATDVSPGDVVSFELASEAHGHDDGMVIPNFSNGAPDIGAQETGESMCFGHLCK